MVDIIFDSEFKKIFLKIKDTNLKKKLKQQIRKIGSKPEIGKPMRYGRKGTREIYIKPYRLVYGFKDNTIIFLDLYHKDKQ